MAGVRIEPQFGLQTTEDGGTASFTIQLEGDPSASVTIGLSSNNPQEATIDRSEVDLHRDNWNSPQSIVITGLDDLVDDGDTPF